MEDILKRKIDELIANKELTFGWNEDITEYTLVSFNGFLGSYKCDCQYIEKGQKMNKVIQIDI